MLDRSPESRCVRLQALGQDGSGFVDHPHLPRVTGVHASRAAVCIATCDAAPGFVTGVFGGSDPGDRRRKNGAGALEKRAVRCPPIENSSDRLQDLGTHHISHPYISNKRYRNALDTDDPEIENMS